MHKACIYKNMSKSEIDEVMHQRNYNVQNNRNSIAKYIELRNKIMCW